MARHTKTKKTARSELAYKVETSKFGLFGIRLLVSILTLLLIAAYTVGFFMTERASKSVYVISPYIALAIPILLTVCGTVLLWQVKAIFPRALYGKAIKMPKAAATVTAVLAVLVLVCDFIIAAFADKQAHLKDELPFLLMCALCCILSVAVIAVRRAIKCSEISQVTAPPPPPAPPYPGYDMPGQQDIMDRDFGDRDR